METLADTPANADNLAPVEPAEVDSEAVQAEGGESASPAPEPGTPERDKVQERIDKLTREKYDALRDRDIKDMELQRLRDQLAQYQKPEAPAHPVAPDTPPTLSQFEYDEAKYAAAMIDYLEAKALSKVDQKLSEIDRRADESKRYSTWQAKEADFIKSTPDYVDKVHKAPTLPIAAETQKALMELDDGPQLAYYLVENREAAEAIMKLPFAVQMRELGRISERIASQKAAAKPPVSQAPPPVAKIATVESTAHVSTTDASGDKLSDDEWVKLERARLAKKARKAS